MSILPYILTWKLPTALCFIGLSVIPVRHAYRLLRTGNIPINGTVEEVFLSSLLTAVAAVIYPFAAIAIPAIWIAYAHRRLLNAKAWVASLLAVALVAFYRALISFLTTHPDIIP